jgi:hypothetical protein
MGAIKVDIFCYVPEGSVLSLVFFFLNYSNGSEYNTFPFFMSVKHLQEDHLTDMEESIGKPKEDTGRL